MSYIKKLILLFITLLCISGCSQITVKNPDILTCAVVSKEDSQTGKNTYNLLNESTVATLKSDIIDASNLQDLSKYDILYIDKSVIEVDNFDLYSVQRYVAKGGNVFLDNELYDIFTYDFIGAENFVELTESPVNMEYNDNISELNKGINKIRTLINDFSSLYQSDDSLNVQNFGVGVIPTTAKSIASKDGYGIYTINQYGSGYVFFTNPLFSNKLLYDYFAEFVSLNKYGYAIEHVFGNFGKKSAAWDIPVEKSEDIQNDSFNDIIKTFKQLGQIPTFVIPENSYTQVNNGTENDYFFYESSQSSFESTNSEKYTLTVPSYIDNNLILPHIKTDDTTYSSIYAKYNLPIVFYENLDTLSNDRIKKIDTFLNDYNYNTVLLEQIAKSTAAAYNTFINAKWEDDSLKLCADVKSEGIPLYNSDYQNSVGVKIILADNISVDNFNVDANVYYKYDNEIYVSLDKNVQISKLIENENINITSVNLPAKISINKDSVAVKFLEGGMMAVQVQGLVKTTSDGWDVTQQNNVTTFRKYGNAETLKIVK